MNRALKIFVVIISILFSVNAFSNEIPSCIQVVANKNSPGAAPDCAPLIMENEKAFKMIQQLKAQKLGHNWYVFFSKEGLKNLKKDKQPYSFVWKMLALLVSATQTLYEHFGDLYVVITPKNKEELQKLLIGTYPQNKTIAFAKSVLPSNLLKLKFPPKHRHEIYRLIVYDFMNYN